ncbi:MAG: hypothetical protein ACLVJ7_17580 [Acutalibacteraceae bacterium]|jgi:hypothetical protein
MIWTEESLMFSPARFHSKIKPTGSSPAIACPACRQAVKMRIFNSFELFKVMEIPVRSFHSRYFAVCPQCASVFELEENAAKAFENGNAAFLTNSRFHLLKQGKAVAQDGESL